MDRSVILIFISGLTILGCSENVEKAKKIDSTNWDTVITASETDPFTKLQSQSDCFMVDKMGEFHISNMSSGVNPKLIFSFSPSSLQKLLQDHEEDLARIRRYFSSLRDGSYASGGIYTHSRLTNASGVGQVISQMGFESQTPLEYPHEVPTQYPPVKDENGLGYDFESFCNYSMIDRSGEPIKRGQPYLLGCDVLSFTLTVSDLKKLTEESTKLKDMRYVLRVDTYVTKFDGKNSDFFSEISKVRSHTYNFPIDFTGLSESLDKLLTCNISV